MNITIISSSRDNISDYYKSIARSISNYLANDDNNLIFGGSSKSMMGITYDEFCKHGKSITAITIDKYKDDLLNMKLDNSYVLSSTFDMKKYMHNNSDLIVMLPGGIGTVSEMFAILEENRSSKSVPIIIYDEDNYYDKLIDFIKMSIDKEFTSNDDLSSISIAKSKNEFIDLYLKYKNNIIENR